MALQFLLVLNRHQARDWTLIGSGRKDEAKVNSKPTIVINLLGILFIINASNPVSNEKKILKIFFYF